MIGVSRERNTSAGGSFLRVHVDIRVVVVLGVVVSIAFARGRQGRVGRMNHSKMQMKAGTRSEWLRDKACVLM
jgi:hypothetical protein